MLTNNGNRVLVTLSGFGALDSIGGDLVLGVNSILRSPVSAFERLRSIGGQLSVSHNGALTSFPAFPALRSIASRLSSSRTPLSITSNARLSTCCVLFPFVQATLPPGYTLGGDRNALNIIFNARGCYDEPQIKADTRCLIEASTPELRGLPAAGGSFAVDLSFRHGRSLYAASSGEGGFLTVPSSSSTSFTVTYPQNTAFAPRVDTLIIAPTDDAFDVPPLRRIVIQHGTARAILGDVTLNSLEDITPEIRAAQYIMGNLTIGDGSSGTDLTNAHIADFAVDTITGNLIINGTKIAELDAFSSLRHVGGNLNIGGIITGDGNPSLTTAAGFGALESVGGRLVVGYNILLTTISAFDELESIGGALSVRNNAVLTSLSTFEQLRSIGGGVGILSNAALPSLPAFEQLRSIGGLLSVSSNAALKSLPAFPVLRSIAGELSGSDSPLIIISNAILSSCCVLFPFLQATLPPGYTLGGDRNAIRSGSIGFNAATCNSVMAINSTGACHNLRISASTSGVILDEEDRSTISVQLSSHIGTAELTIDIEGNASGWTATEDPDEALLTAITASGEDEEVLTLTFSANTTASPRRATVRLSTTGTGTSISKTLSLTQAPMGTIVGDITLDSLEAITPAIRAATRIEGNLTIGDGEAGDDITNAALARLQVDTITGGLTISGTKLARLDAFNSLKHVGGNLRIGFAGKGNAMLGSVSGFNALIRVAGSLHVYGNADIETVNGFDMLETVGGELGFYENNELSSISGLGSLRNVGELTFEYNPLLTSVPDFPLLTVTNRINLLDNSMLGTLPSFDRLETVWGNLGISNLAVTSISGFPSLTTISGNLIIASNSRLRSVSGFPLLASAGGLHIGGGAGGNPMLETVSGFPALRSIVSSGDAVVISGNRMFASCCVLFPFLQSPLPPGYTLGDNSMITIRDNASGCNSAAEIKVPGRCLLDGAIIGDITLNSMEDLTPEIRDAQYILGDLTISDESTGTDLENSDLKALQVEEIRGNLTISSTTLDTLDAFSSLRRIEGDLTIERNTNLAILDNFSALDSIGGDLRVASNAELTRIDAFSALRSVGRDFYIGGNNSSDGNAMLGTLSGLNALEHIGRELLVRYSNALTTATGFERLDSVGNLRIQNNRVLRSLPDFRRLRIIVRSLVMDGNVALTSLPAFPALRSIGSGLASSNFPIEIVLNDNLATCCGVFPFVQSPLPDGFTLGGNGTKNISSNTSGCRREAEIRATTSCLLSATTTPDLAALPAEAGTITVNLNFHYGTTDWAASVPAGSFLTVPSSGSSTSFTVNYEQNTAAAPREEVLTITPTDDAFDVPPLRFPITQHGTANAIIGDIVLDSLEAITAEIREAQYIVGSLIIGDGEVGTPITNAALARLQIEEIRGDLLIQDTELSELSAFSSLRSIGGSLEIGAPDRFGANAMLESITGFGALDSIGGFLVIGYNNELTKIADFERLRIVVQGLSVINNAALPSLPRFPALRSIGSGLSPSKSPIGIISNATLTTCCALYPFLQDTPPTGYTLGGGRAPIINGNGTDCASTGSITAAGACHGLAARAATAGLRLSEGDTIEVLLSSHIGTASLIINTEGGASGWTATRDPDGALITAVTASGSSGEALELTLSANTTASLRRDTVTLSTTGTGTPISKTLSLTQAAQGTIAGDVVLDSLEAITEAIRSATRIEGSLLIGDGEEGENITNPELARLQVETITGALTISGTRLATLDAFSELTTIGDSLVVRENALLDSLLGFAALNSIGAELASEETPLLIEDNGTLSLCCGVSPFVQASLSSSYTLGGNARPRIEGNATGCASDQKRPEMRVFTQFL